MPIWRKVYDWICGSSESERRETPPCYHSIPDDWQSLPYDHEPCSPLSAKDTETISQASPSPRTKDLKRHPVTASDDKEPVDWSTHNVVMKFEQHISDPPEGWQAVLQLKALDVPDLLRKGLHWTDANVDHEAGYVMLGDPSTLLPEIESSQQYIRVYFLKDLGEEPQWTARMLVYATDLHRLSAFRFSDLEIDQMTECWACRADGSDIYAFQRTQESASYVSTLYKDMPLDGWWPMPKASKASDCSDASFTCI